MNENYLVIMSESAMKLCEDSIALAETISENAIEEVAALIYNDDFEGLYQWFSEKGGKYII